MTTPSYPAPSTVPTFPTNIVAHEAPSNAAGPVAVASSLHRQSPASPTTDEVTLRRNAKRRLTELGNAYRLVDYHGPDLRYCAKLGGWQVWDGTRWIHDETGVARLRAKDVVNAKLYDEARTLTSEEERNAHRKFAHRFQTNARVEGMLHLAATEEEIAVRSDAFDTDLWLFNVATGTIDLRDGQHRPHDRDDLISKLSQVAYDPAATCPTWDKFLARVLDGNTELHDYLQTLVGYSLTGETDEHLLPVLYGRGRNGKSTFLHVLEKLFGDYVAVIDPKLLLESNGDAHPTGRAYLRGARLVITSETDREARIDENLIKQLTGGDTIQARYMRQDPFEFKPTFTIFLATNNMPKVSDTGEAIWSRLKRIPFTVEIPAPERDPQLRKKLEKELPGILRWALEGLARYRTQGLVEPAIVTEGTKIYREESDVIGRFIDDKCEFGDDKIAYAKDLYAAYTQWCADEGETAQSQNTFGTSLRERGYGKLKSHGPSRRAAWQGIYVAP